MKIKNKEKYVFKRNNRFDDYPYGKLTFEEFKSFVEENITYHDENFFYRGNRIYCYIGCQSLKPLKYMFIQIGIRSCMKISHKEGRLIFESCYYNNPDLKCYLIGKEV